MSAVLKPLARGVLHRICAAWRAAYVRRLINWAEQDIELEHDKVRQALAEIALAHEQVRVYRRFIAEQRCRLIAIETD